MSNPILQLKDLHVAYKTGGRWTDVVRGVSLDIQKGETVGIVGESGCGKSTVAFSVMNYLGGNGKISGGQILYQGQDLSQLSDADVRAIRGKKIAMVYQNPLSALNPSLRIGRQIAEVVQLHEGLSKRDAADRALQILKKVHMPAPDSVINRYPHQLSGGMQQRVVVAMALITNPDLLIMDEPTTGLDVTTEAAVLDLVNELKQEYDAAILYISHNLGVIAEVCDRVNVMYAGQVVETGDVQEIFTDPCHPYALDLLECVPRLDWHYQDQPLRTIEGRVPLPTELPSGCVYAPRCRFAQDRCHQERPGWYESGTRMVRCFFVNEIAEEVKQFEEKSASTRAGTNGKNIETDRLRSAPQPSQKPLLDLADLRKYYPYQGQQVKAVDGINFAINEGETFSLVGESGCGKSTLGRCVVGLLTPTDGKLTYNGEDVGVDAAERSPEVRQAMQVVFQNPEATLNPQHRVGRILGRTLQFFGVDKSSDRQQRIEQLLEGVRLDGSYAKRYPKQLSGGEKQRIAIARAFAGNPNLIVCDEAVSALDVSVQASILNLLVDLKDEEQCAYLFISHDLAVVRYISDRIGVMYLGQLMEIGTSEQIFSGLNHPYTEALLSAVQSPDQQIETEPIRLEGSVPSPLNPPPGCPFQTRCPRKVGSICETDPPPWRDAGEGHGILCHIELDELEQSHMDVS